MINFLPMRFNNRSWLHQMDREFENMNRLFEGLNQTMRCDVEDLGDHLELNLEVPGYRKEDISLNVKDDVLIIRAERNDEYENSPEITPEKAKDGENVPSTQKAETSLSKQRSFIHKERSYQTTERRFNVEEIETDGITAKYENGILTVTLPKKNPTEKEDNIHTINID